MTASFGREPYKVIVTEASRRHVSDPAVSLPITSMPPTFSVMPLEFSPRISSDVLGIVITPKTPAIDCRMTTLVLAGSCTFPPVGTLPPQVEPTFQSRIPASR